MIDTVYQTLLTLLNKENAGYVSPTEFNLLANTVQQKIFRGYFSDIQKDSVRKTAGLTARGYANLDKVQKHLIQQFASSDTIALTAGAGSLPSDLYLIEQDGILTDSGETYPSRVVEETDRINIGYLNLSEASPTELYPIFENLGTTIQVLPTTISSVTIRYIRKPSFPNWTYVTVSNQPMYNAADGAHQDFELHESEFANIVIEMLSMFGITIREADVVQVAETLKDKTNIKENS